MSSFSNHNTNNTRSVILTPSFLVLSLKVQSILKFVIKSVLLLKLIWWPISLIPFVRSSAFKRRLRLVLLILSLGEIIPSYSYYIEKRLSYIIISVFFSRQPSFYIKCIKLNIYLSYNVKLVSNAKYIYLMHFYIL